MKVNGKSLSGPKIQTLVLPHGDGDDYIVFKFRAITSKDKFEDVMPRPMPPLLKKPGGEEFRNLEDPRYKAAIEDWASKKIDWEFLQSISVTEGLEWSKVKLDDPNTWHLWREELNEHFGIIEFNRVFSAYLDANMLSEERLDEARKRFLASQATSQLSQ